ncbi:hypothetical protein [Candidatus Poriferisodalis sp.]|uniref:hypothetical protein n=1 Tax=Candidatus Poriferisodalis sp. TaxID=3101277 RepID=UPI003B5B569E
MSATETDAKRPVKWSRWEWLGFTWVGMTTFSIFGSDVPGVRLVRTVVFAAIFGAMALWAGRDSRERWTGVLAAGLVLAVGLLSSRLLSPGWTLLIFVAMSAVAGGALVGWQMRRTPDVPAKKPEPNTPVVQATKPKQLPVPGCCRWCGLRPRAAICGGRSDGGTCEPAEAAAANPA